MVWIYQEDRAENGPGFLIFLLLHTRLLLDHPPSTRELLYTKDVAAFYLRVLLYLHAGIVGYDPAARERYGNNKLFTMSPTLLGY